MKKLKPNIALFITLFLLLIGGLFIKGSFLTYERCFEREKGRIDEYFTYISENAALHAAGVYEDMLSEAQAKADLISHGIESTQELDDIFNTQYLPSKAEDGLFLSAEGFFEYGKEEYKEDFGYTAILAAHTGETKVSKVLLCDDGQRRFAVAAP
ncbi:MAG: hypothetical protein GX025_03980, partial [Clostridiales bacterium]|nr:hypothetical protein [Clostridiales bacterium]